MCGTAAGKRSLNSVRDHGDARLFISSSAAGGGDCRPRSVPTAMGKNVRNAPSTLAVSQRGHSQPAISTLPLQVASSGASAMRGTVWEMTR
jgi:hypothetical protein